MNIKEIEISSGLSRANIRFYEKEGLLKPIRRENGYRDYSSEDLETLKRIRLLRELEISLEQIKDLQKNPAQLHQVMRQRIQSTGIEIAGKEKAIEICEEIQADKVTFNSMDAGHYLEHLESQTIPESHGDTEGSMVLAQDRERVTYHPWKRFFARYLDLAFYGFLIALVWNVFLHKLPVLSGNGIVVMLLREWEKIGVMIVLEPCFLALFGTTPGKWIFGITVCEQSGRKLTYTEALTRTGKVVLWGMGLGIFGIEIYRWYKGFCAVKAGEETEWEYYCSTIEYRERKKNRWLTAVLVSAFVVICFGGIWFANVYRFLPINREELTVTQFAENYNYYVKLFGRLSGNKDSEKLLGSLLNESGQFLQDNGQEMVFVSVYDEPALTIDYQEENGVLTSISFEQMIPSSGLVKGYQEQMRYMILAFAGAQKEIGIGEMIALMKEIDGEQLAFKDYDFTKAGIHIRCDVEYNEKIWTVMQGGEVMLTTVEEPQDFYMRFVMEKITP